MIRQLISSRPWSAAAEAPDVTLVCFGDGVTLAEATAERLAHEELAVEIVVPSLLSPFPRHTLSRALAAPVRLSLP